MDTTLFNQSIESLHLKKYALIFIAVGSFQLISERDHALKVLRVLHDHLLPGGSLVLDTFIPWDNIQAALEGNQTVSSEREVMCPDGNKIILHSSTTIDLLNQLESSKTLYSREKEVEEEDLDVRWYYPYEMELLLEKGGFTSISMTHQSFKHNPRP